jgi:DNA invertase Pin-like site-specific DNA recombinase
MASESLVKQAHLNRLAFIYYRQSDPKQVLKNTGSREYQLAQVEHARRLGWNDKNIRVVDQDAGRSGTTTIGRTSYQEMVRETEGGRVGGIFASDLDRIGRDEIELFQLFRNCILFDTLIVIDGKPIDLANSDELLLQQIRVLLSRKEVSKIRDRMRQGLVGILSKRLAVSRPPGGYVIVSKGKWDFDPEQLAQASVHTAFRTILELRSFSKAARALRAQGVRLPRRVRETKGSDELDVDDGVRVLRWQQPTEAALLFMAKNPAYTGDYVYGRQRVDPKLRPTPKGKLRMRQAGDEELHVIPNHHPAYITHEQFAELQHIIEINRPSQERRNMGDGPAVLQGGIVRCGVHRNRAMRVSYVLNRTGKVRWWYYVCTGERLAGGDGCGSVPGGPLEDLVVGVLLDRLNPPRLEELRAAWQAARSAEGDEEYRHEAQLASVREEVRKAKLNCRSVDREKNPAAAEFHDGVLNDALTRLKKLESVAALPRTALSLFTEESWRELLALSHEVRALWDAATTTVQDKKELVRTLVKAVVMESMSRDQVRPGHIVWQDSIADTRFELATRESVRTRILELKAEGLRHPEIAERLNQEDVKTLQGNPWSGETIRKRIKEYERRCTRGTDGAA